MTTLDKLRDDDGLISVNEIDVDPIFHRNVFLKRSGCQIFIEPRAYGVADLILPRLNLSSIAKLRFNQEQCGLKRAPIFGVTFKHALTRLGETRPGVILKSMYKLLNTQGFSDYGSCATLVAHFQTQSNHIQIEIWQFTQDSDDTSYIHGLIRNPSGPFTHLDGASISHTSEELKSLFTDGNKVKGRRYSKQFRLDGEISMSDAVALADAFLPGKELTAEYFERSVESNTSQNR